METSPVTALDELLRWLEESWDPDLTLREWWARLASSGWCEPHWPVAWHGRGLSRTEARTVTRADSRVRRGHRPDRLWHRPCRADPARARDRRSEGAASSGHGRGNRRLLPALQRAQRRVGPCRAAVPGRARRRSMGGQRAEGMDVGWPDCQQGDAGGAHRCGRPQAHGDFLLHHRHAPAGRRGPSVTRDDWSCLLQRGFPDRGSRPRRGPCRRGGKRVGGGQYDPCLRARPVWRCGARGQRSTWPDCRQPRSPGRRFRSPA